MLLEPDPDLACEAAKTDTSLFGCLTTGSGSFPDEIPFELSDAGENSHDHLSDMRGGVCPRL